MASHQARELTKAQREAGDVDQSGSAYNMFKIAAQHLESAYGLSMDIQEKYGYQQQPSAQSVQEEGEEET